jgi:uncharacterized protein YyaL (SSP411 family)
MTTFQNALSEASSPYLLQHSNNPVNWVEWSQEAFERAEKEQKLVLVSIGYSACHWCHVMEHESFENETVAELMNKHFVCIKVDREERPDVDQVYMNAVQLMTQKGGWPLNCFTLADGRPIYGGTYFPKEQWMQVLKNLWDTFEQDPAKVEEYARKLKEGVQLSEMIEVQPLQDKFDPEVVTKLVSKWKRSFDFDYGGENRAPKFPLPNNYEFLLHYGALKNDKTVINHVIRSLTKMARGGIYDQIGGGFARYAVDQIWKIPHFEKMLYDNGQLISLYAKAHQFSENREFKKVIDQIIEWLDREMYDSDSGGYYAALDADSEGVEGKFYTWTETELKELLGEDYSIAKAYYNVNQKGYWEDDVYILLREKDDPVLAQELNLSLNELELKVSEIESKLLKIRNKRIAPGLDNKKITSWNALLLKGFADAGFALNNQGYTEKAKGIARWIKKEMFDDQERLLYRVKGSKSNEIHGFLDDYANTIDALITLYEHTFESEWIDFAHVLAQKANDLFSDIDSHLFFYTEEKTELIARKMEINDNVIPSSNSVMAKNLFKLGILYHKEDYTKRAKQMLSNVYDQMPQYGSGYSNWAQLALYFEQFKEVAVMGKEALLNRQKLNSEYLPFTVFAGGSEEHIPFLKGRKTETIKFYVCENNVCQAPSENIKELLKELQL